MVDAAATLVAGGGLLSLTMSRVAERAGIGRATLYKYFPDIESVLLAWHERQVSRHLQQLHAARKGARGPAEELSGVLRAYALVCQQAGAHHHTELAMVLHRPGRLGDAHGEQQGLLREVLASASDAGLLRTDIGPEELLSFCQHALAGAAVLGEPAAVDRLVELTLAGLRPPSSPPSAGVLTAGQDRPGAGFGPEVEPTE